MCGICGIIGVADKDLIKRMALAMNHRGPDGSNTLVTGGNSFGFTRLSIIDLDHGMQPMFNETGDIITLINGEIYNYKTLRADLSEQGHQFQTNCDAEILPHLYEQYGTDCFKQMNGMFAVAIWDNNRLILSRDRIGKKPLYYVQYKDIFLFASEIKSLLQFGEINYTFNHQFAYPHAYFEMECNTFIAEIKQVRPGHVLIYENGQPLVEEPYWSYPNEEFLEDEAAIIEQLKSTLEDSVRLRLQADVPVGVLLSGGLDSNIILALTSKYKKEIKTFTVGSYTNSESEIARQSAKQFNTDHHELFFTVEDMQRALPSVVLGVESCEPRTIDTSIPMFLITEELKKYVTVILCGEGADEIFCGYQSFFMHLKTDEEIYQECIKHSSSLYNLNVRRVDGVSMHHSIEARCPFLDYRVVDLAFKVKPLLKTKGVEKYILRKAFESELSPDIINRRKVNFNVGTGIISDWEDWLRVNLTSKVTNNFRIKELASPKRPFWQAMDGEVFHKYMLLLVNLFYEMFLEGNNIRSVKEFIS